MATLNDILRMTQYFEMSGRHAVMVSFWKVTYEWEENPPCASIAEMFHQAYADVVGLSAMSSVAKLTRTLVDNMSSPLEYGDYSEDRAGGQSGDNAPPFVAISVKQNVASRLTRAGFKRMPYIPETFSSGGNLTLTAPIRAAIEGFWEDELLLENPISFDDMVTIHPVVVGRTLVPTPTPHYELDLDKVQLVVSAFAQTVTSQVSRKQ